MLRSSFVLCGPIGSGKTEVIKRVLGGLGADTPRVGFREICLKKGNTRLGYDLITDICGATKRFPFIRQKKRIDINEGMLFDFSRDTMNRALEFFQNATYSSRPSLLYFDEFGRMEAKGGGLWKTVRFLVTKFEELRIPYSCLVALRKENLRLFDERIRSDLPWKAVRHEITRLPVKNIDELVRKIRHSLSL